MVTLVGEVASVTFPCPRGATVDEAARAAGYRLRVVCARGGCGACGATLVSGRVEHRGAVSSSKVSDPSTGHRLELLCRAMPIDDVVLRPVNGWTERARRPWSAVIGAEGEKGARSWQ